MISAVFKVGEIDVSSDYDPKLIVKKAVIVQDNVTGNSLARRSVSKMLTIFTELNSSADAILERFSFLI